MFDGLDDLKIRRWSPGSVQIVGGDGTGREEDSLLCLHVVLALAVPVLLSWLLPPSNKKLDSVNWVDNNSRIRRRRRVKEGRRAAWTTGELEKGGKVGLLGTAVWIERAQEAGSVHAHCVHLLRIKLVD